MGIITALVVIQGIFWTLKSSELPAGYGNDGNQLNPSDGEEICEEYDDRGYD